VAQPLVGAGRWCVLTPVGVDSEEFCGVSHGSACRPLDEQDSPRPAHVLGRFVFEGCEVLLIPVLLQESGNVSGAVTVRARALWCCEVRSAAGRRGWPARRPAGGPASRRIGAGRGSAPMVPAGTPCPGGVKMPGQSVLEI